MTVIAWDGTTLAADKMLSDNIVWRTCKKIREVNGCLIATCGDADLTREVVAWLANGGFPEDFPESARHVDNLSEVLVITEYGEIHMYQRTPYPIIVEGNIVAMGNGRDAAMAVMALGHDAIKAVEIANQVCTGCGGGIDSMVLNRRED